VTLIIEKAVWRMIDVNQSKREPMFGERQGRRIPITLTLTNGQTLVGALMAGLSGSIASSLNREGAFLELIAENGELVFVAKSSITMAREGALGKTFELAAIANGASSEVAPERAT
jgi:hypothetical protein